MKITEYVEQSRSVAMYHDKSPVANFTYPALGLAGEVGETIDKLTLVSISKNEIIKELGDILWYAVNISEDAGLDFIKLVDIMTDSVLTIATFTELGNKLAYGNDARSSLIQLPIYAGRIAEIAKKMIRDSAGKLPSEKMPILKDSICQILLCLFNICSQWSINMDDVAQTNIDKLFSRQRRGVLSGSGDNR